MRLRYLPIFVLLLLAVPAQAKGPADRIIVTGPTIAGEMILTYPEMTYPLSFTLLEDFSAGPVGEPAQPGDVFYELERQFLTGKDRFQTFDRARFYPESGDVFYIGIENGWSEYDKKWFHARPEARDVLATLLNPTAHPALVLMQGNEIRFVDPVTLADLTAFEIPVQLEQTREFVDGPDATTFDFTGTQSGEVPMNYRANLASLEACPISARRIPAAETIGIPWIVAGIVDRQNRAFEGANFVSVDAFSEGRALLYQPDTTTAGDNLPGGILIFSLDRGRRLEQWLPDHRFSQVIAGGDQLFALEISADGMLLLRLRVSDGFIVNTRTLPGGLWSLGYGLFDLSAFDQSITELQMCR